MSELTDARVALGLACSRLHAARQALEHARERLALREADRRHTEGQKTESYRADLANTTGQMRAQVEACASAVSEAEAEVAALREQVSALEGQRDA